METMSLPGAAFAVAHGAKMPRIGSAAGRATFTFDDDIQGLLDDYFSGGTVSGRDFYRALKDI